MERVGVDSLIARIERVAAEVGGGALAFDGDGTLWSGDIGDDYLFALIGRGDVRPVARQRLVIEAEACGLPSGGTGAELAQRLFDAYCAGRYAERAVCEMIAWLCAGWSQAEVAHFAEGVVVAHKVAERLHPETTRIAGLARAAGLRTVVVSASPLPVVRLAAALAGFTEVVAATPLYEGVLMRAAIDGPIPYGEGKVVRLRERIGDLSLIAAFGDNAFDVPMLRAARIAVAVRPKQRLVALAGELPELLLLEA